MNGKRLFLCLWGWLILSLSLHAEVRLPGFFSDHMVIQCDEPVKFWGWADKNENVRITFNGKTVHTRAGKKGTWEVTWDAMPFGGPYVLTVEGKNNRLQLEDILIGDVWLCSGQSNMEWTVKHSADADAEIQSADYPSIRSLDVARSIKGVPQDDVQGVWKVCSPSTVGDFSAVAYYYARALHRELNIPIGIINASWGGTDIEAWTSRQSFKELPAAVQKTYNEEIVDNLEEYLQKNSGNWAAYLNAMTHDPAMNEKWYSPDYDFSSWDSMAVPGEWGSTPLAVIDGHVWFKYEFTLPEGASQNAAVLSLGTIDDNDVTWINGTEVGSIQGYNISRVYNIPAGVLKDGKNIITVRITDTGGGGGIQGVPGNIYLKLQGKNERIISLADTWLYKASVTNADFNVMDINANVVQGSLYNAMIHPLLHFRIKGAIWYQGENNAGEAYNYRTLFPNMIRNWRNKWGYVFPFYWVQLANFFPEDDIPVGSTWAELREAQTLTLALPQTGQAVIYDIGNPFDIHPTNKQDVGKRLALIALKQTYGYDAVICSGPTFKSVDISGNKMIITMETHGSRLMAGDKYGCLRGFTVAGADRKFYWAKAWVENGKIIVSSEQVSHPVAVRYAWANNPGANLFNEEGLPAVPFRTDDWKGITQMD